MPLQYLLDTNVISETMLPDPDPQVRARIVTAARSVAAAATTWFELAKGLRLLPEGKRRRHIQTALENIKWLDILPYDGAAATWHAEQHASLARIGKTPPFLDAQIAAVAAVNGLVLVTRNVRDFRYFEGLRVESWFS